MIDKSYKALRTNEEHGSRLKLRISDAFQRSWRGFYENQNKAATVIQTAWRTSLKRSSHKKGDNESKTRLGRDRYTYHNHTTTTTQPILLALL